MDARPGTLAPSPTSLALSLIALLLGATSATGQADIALYHFTTAPQTALVNPATAHRAKWWLGVPVLSGAHAAFRSDVAAFGTRREEGAELLRTLRASASELEPDDVVSLDGRVALFDLGWSLPDSNIVSVSIAQRVTARARVGNALPYAYFGDSSPLSGAAPGVDLAEGLRISANARLEFAVGWQRRRAGARFQYGWRAKLLIGQAGLYYDEGTAVVGGDGVVGVNGVARTSRLRDEFDGSPGWLAPGLGNLGLAADLGASYRVDERWTLSASVVDVGFLRFGSEVEDYVSEGPITEWPGVEAFLDDDPDFGEVIDAGERLRTDTDVESRYRDGAAFARGLAARAYLGAEYGLADGSSAGVVYRALPLLGTWRHAAAASFNWRASDRLQASASYGFDGPEVNVVGAALGLTLRGVNVYAAVDDAVALVNPASARRLGFSLGVQLVSDTPRGGPFGLGSGRRDGREASEEGVEPR